MYIMLNRMFGCIAHARYGSCHCHLFGTGVERIPAYATKPNLKNVNEASAYFRLIIISSDWAVGYITPERFVQSFSEDLPVLAQVIAVADINPC